MLPAGRTPADGSACVGGAGGLSSGIDGTCAVRPEVVASPRPTANLEERFEESTRVGQNTSREEVEVFYEEGGAPEEALPPDGC